MIDFEYIKSLRFAADICLLVFVFVQFYGLFGSALNGVFLISGCAWLFLSMIENHTFFSQNFLLKENIFLLLFVFFFGMISFFKNPLQTVIAGSLATYLRYCSIFMVWVYIRDNDRFRLSFVTKMITLIVLYFGFMATLYYLQNPGVARYLVSHPSELLPGLGGNAYGMCISLDLISLFYLNQYLRMVEKNWKNTSFFIIVMVMAFFLSSAVDSATTFFIYFMSVGVSLLNIFLFKEKQVNEVDKKKIYRIVFFCFILVFVYVFRFFFSDFLLDLSENLDFVGPFIKDRLAKVSAGIVGGDMGESFASRIDLIGVSINAFLHHPIVGMDVYASDVTFDVIGQHSEFFDILGRYGLIGGFFFFSSMALFMKNVYLNCFHAFSPIVLFIVFNAILNPMHYTQTLFVFFFLVPLLICRYNKLFYSRDGRV